MLWRSALDTVAASILCWLLIALPIKAEAQVAQALQNAAEGGLFGKIPDFPKTPAQLQRYLVMRGVSTVLGDTLPIKLDGDNLYPLVDDNVLPGGAFHGKTLELTAETLTSPILVGDWTVKALAFCQEYSAHQPGAGTAYKMGPLQGTKAQAIAALLWRGVYAGKSPSELQLVEWAIESGVPYSDMPKPYQADIDQLIPSYKDQLQGDWTNLPDAKYDSIIKKPVDALKTAPIPGLGFAAQLMVRTMPTPPATFSDFLKTTKMGKAGEYYDQFKTLKAKFLQDYKDEQIRAQVIYSGQGSKLPPMPAQNGPWTDKGNGVYMRFVVHGGNLQADNELQIRVTATPHSVAKAQHKAHLVLASYDPQAMKPLGYSQQATLLSLMGVTLAGPGFAVAGRGVVALEATELAGLVISGAAIAFAAGVAAQALIIVLPIVLSHLKHTEPVAPVTTANPSGSTTASKSKTCNTPPLCPPQKVVGRPKAVDLTLQGIYRQLWRDEDQNPGGTVGELCREIQQNPEEQQHYIKASDRLRQITKRLTSSDPLVRSDRVTAELVQQDLRNAVRTADVARDACQE